MELKKINKYGRAKCACCGYNTIKEIAETCPVCYWEENIFQEAHQEDNDAPNYISLKQAKENFQKIGAIKPDAIKYTRKPNDEELESM